MSRRRHDDDHDDRPAAQGSGPFGWGMGLACGVLAALLLAIGIPIVCCAALGVGGIGAGAAKLASETGREPAGAKPAAPRPAR